MTILLATFNGRKFLAAQLHSLAGQTASRVDILASDDGSTDGTPALLEAASVQWTKGNFAVLEGPKRGSPTENFRSLILAADEPGDFVAFCDQDDVWQPTKLEAAISKISAHPELPQVYCSRTTLIDVEGRTIGLSPYFPKPPDFRNALVQSLAGGNTMVMNRKAFELVRAASALAHFVAHDWWVYQIVTGAGGRITYSASPDTLYRQHADNEIGANVSIGARLVRIVALFKGRFRCWNDINLEALRRCKHLLTPESVQVLHDFRAARTGSLPQRFAALSRSGVFRQTLASQISLYVACAFRLL